MHWCRRRVRFNEVPEKVPKVPEKVWEALVQGQVRFNRVLEKVPGQVQRGSGEGLGGFGAEPGQVRVPEKVPEKVRGSLGAKPSQVPENVRLWCRARSG